MADSARAATPADVPAMVALSAAKRAAYARVVPHFWRAADGADARQAAWFERLLSNPDAIARVRDGASGLDGFAIGLLSSAPPVYDPGGRVLTVDDLCVASPAAWPTVGKALLDAVRSAARSRGAAVEVVVCGAHDAPKKALLDRECATVASHWFATPL